MNKFDKEYKRICEEYQINEFVASKYKETILPVFVKIALANDIGKQIKEISDYLDITTPPKIEYDDANLSDNQKQI